MQQPECCHPAICGTHYPCRALWVPHQAICGTISCSSGWVSYRTNWFLFCFSPDKVLYHISCSPSWPQSRYSSAVLTAPALQSHVSSSVSVQIRHQARPSAVPPALVRFGNHVVLHFPSEVNCHTKPSVAPTPWQVFSKDGQSQSMQAPARLKYSANESKSPLHCHKLNWGGSSKYNHRIIKCSLCL